jgi:hypothetical protein
MLFPPKRRMSEPSRHVASGTPRGESIFGLIIAIFAGAGVARDG